MWIRHAQTTDLAAIVQLYLGFRREPWPQPPSQTRMLEAFGALQGRGHIAVAELDGQLVGSYSLYWCPSLNHGVRPFALLENVIVVQALRRQGVGRALMTHARDAARLAGCYKLMLATGAGAAAERFYQACGFSADKTGFQIRFD